MLRLRLMTQRLSNHMLRRRVRRSIPRVGCMGAFVWVRRSIPKVHLDVILFDYLCWSKLEHLGYSVVKRSIIVYVL